MLEFRVVVRVRSKVSDDYCVRNKCVRRDLGTKCLNLLPSAGPCQ